ncbi:hypothetical protein ElyMa_002179800 [Elysia marginata]|uniref:Uncharacterized protein n=1 Tax=Elysia marginata TaxID=1093978 RepID=A0AAV4FPB1_9GAST|nr:hypothetical protein ElyMa_002179800 [Elysia marginata]
MSSRSSRPSVHPVFFHASTLGGGPHGTVDICSSAEMTTGPGGVYGSQKIAGVIRLYPATEAGRVKLLATGFTYKGTRIQTSPTHPSKNFLYEDKPVEAVRLVISNTPLSVANAEIEKEVKVAGYKTLTSINEDLPRD